jgi:hypothetical protein
MIGATRTPRGKREGLRGGREQVHLVIPADQSLAREHVRPVDRELGAVDQRGPRAHHDEVHPGGRLRHRVERGRRVRQLRRSEPSHEACRPHLRERDELGALLASLLDAAQRRVQIPRRVS